jgi:LysR family transcriptional regulator, glycine cleavage system transcriptional activator
MSRRLSPPHHLLKAFATTAQFGSISRAAESLNLTQSAVSKQVQELERWTGVPLFERVRKRLCLTPAGQRYEVAIRPLLAQIEAATLELITSGDGGGALHLSTLPTFGSKWLIPRLPEFTRLHPHIAVRFVPYVQGYDFHRTDLDCSILLGNGYWPGAVAHYITGQRVVLIAPPAATLRRPQDISRFALLQHVSVPQAWTRWCEQHQVQSVNPLAGPQLDQYHSLIRAVMAGMGLSLVPECLVRDDISAGLVSTPFIDGYQETLGYYLCYPEAREHLAPLVSFRQWLLQTAQADFTSRQG